jgi:hypothetical protein
MTQEYHLILAVAPDWVFAIPLLVLIPWALLDANPGISVAGCIQSAFILGVMLVTFLRLLKRPSAMAGLLFGLSYPSATLVSNAVAFMTMRNLLH